ncbi:MAG: hypothetical protein ACFFER_17210 [Candidatus Thorarchaeota archaeon]
MRELVRHDCTPIQGAQLKTLGRFKTAQRGLPLSSKDCVSNLGESAAVHHVRMGLLGFGDTTEMGENDPAVASTVERLSADGYDTSITQQKKEARTTGGLILL